MDFYVIPPLSQLELMNYGDRFFCLAQLYKKHEHYRHFFKDKVKDGKWVTLDNGAGDFDLVSQQDLFHIMADLKPSEVIPPDVLFDGIQTIRNLETFTRSMYDAGLHNEIEVFGCPQGKDQQEWLFVYKYMLQHPMVKTIGMSKIAIPKAFLNADNDESIMEARHMCMDILLAHKLLVKPLHFLGMGDPNEFRYYKHSRFGGFARSTDSCNTVWSAMNDIEFNKGNFKRVPTPKDYFNREVSTRHYYDAINNIEWFREQLTS